MLSEIANELKVEAVIQATILRKVDFLQMNADLIEANTEKSLCC